MSLISLRTRSGHYVGLERAPNPRILANFDEPVPFELQELSGGTVALQVFGSGHYLSARTDDDGRVTITDALGPRERFSLIQQDQGAIAFELAERDHRLSVGVDPEHTLLAKPTSQDADQLFELDRLKQLDAALKTGMNACGHAGRDEAGVLWEDKTHAAIVEKAVALLGPLGRVMPDVALFLNRFWTITAFRDGVFRGLRAADYESPWIDSQFAYHFYDPIKGWTFAPHSSVLHAHALSEVRRYFGTSHHAAMRIFRGAATDEGVYARAGRDLGLSLHFLTDLTQPMHAANFTNYLGFDDSRLLPDPGDERHTGFEKKADQVFGRYLDTVPALRPDDFEASNYEIGRLVHEVAQSARGVFYAFLRNVLQNKPRSQWGGEPGNWSQEEIDPVLKASLGSAPKIVARYLVHWSRFVERESNLKSTHWYRILEPMGECASLSGDYLRRQPPDQGDTQLWAVIFNPDATCLLVSKQRKDCAWKLGAAWPDGTRYITYTKDPDDALARFRIAPADTTAVWIYEPDADRPDIVTVNWGWYDGYLIAFTPSYPAKQLFRLQAAEEISSHDRRALGEQWPNYGRYDWSGRRIGA